MPTIMVVEDDIPNRTLISLQVEDLDCEIEQADNGKTALELLRVNKPDLILLDLNMPTMDGFEFLRAIADTEIKSIPVVVITAMYLGKEEHAVLSGLGVLRVFEKGRYDEDDLLDCIGALVGASCN